MRREPADHSPELELEVNEGGAPPDAVRLIEIKRRRSLGWIGALAVLAIGTVVVRQGGSASHSSPSILPANTTAPTTAAPIVPTTVARQVASTSVSRAVIPDFAARIVTWAENVLSVRPLDQLGHDVTIGMLQPVSPPRLSSFGRWVVAEGTELSAERRRGVWVFDATGHTPARFIGAGQAALSPTQHKLWLVDQGQARLFRFDGTPIGDAYPITGSLVGTTGAYLVVNDGGHATGWNPEGSPGFVFPGVAFAADGEMIMWSGLNGGVTFTDPNNGAIVGADPLAPEIGFLFDNGQEFAAARGTDVSFGIVAGTHFEATLPRGVAAFASAPGNVAVALGDDGSLMYLDPSSGTTRSGHGVPTDTVAITVIPEMEWAFPVIASAGDWEVRAYAEEHDEFDAVFFSSGGPYRPLDLHADEPMNALRLEDGTLVGVVNDPLITTVGIPGSAAVPVDYGLGPRLFAFPPGSGLVLIEGFDATGRWRTRISA